MGGRRPPLRNQPALKHGLEQPGPVEFGRDGAGLAGHPAVLVVHLEEQQVSQLLDIVAVRHAVVAQDIAVVPQALDDGGRLV